MSKEVNSNILSDMFSDVNDDNQVTQSGLLLAHYTTLEILEFILKKKEIWMSNPLYMNDFEEVKFGIFEGIKILRESANLRNALGTPNRQDKFYRTVDHYFNIFDNEHVFDTYVFCLSRHDENANDGKLSMWRGYGDNGNGVAIVFDPSKITETSESPLIFSKVEYETAENRRLWLSKKVSQITSWFESNQVDDEDIFRACHAYFERIKLFALFSKHRGFLEEEEWRMENGVYARP